MARPIRRRVCLKYSGDANYLQLLIKELQRQHDASWKFDKQAGYATASAEVELNIPGLNIEWETDNG